MYFEIKLSFDTTAKDKIQLSQIYFAVIFSILANPEVLYKPLLEKEIKMTCRVSGQSRSAPEGVWVQGGGIEIPCFYEIGVKKGLRSLRKELRDKLIQLVPTTDNTI